MLRYVVFTDRLLSEMTPEELEAVFGHEVGHVKHRHILYYLGFLVISVGVVAGIWLAVFGDSDWVMPPMVLSLGAYVFLVFGFLSRRCERQADIYGCRAVSCTHRECPGHSADMVPAPRGIGLCSTGINTFIGALEKVARLNGISRSKPGWLNSWLHSTIACRVEFLQQMLVDPGLEARFQRRVGLVKWGLILALGSILLGLAAWHWFEGKPPSDAAVALSQVCPVDTGIESEG